MSLQSIYRVLIVKSLGGIYRDGTVKCAFGASEAGWNCELKTHQETGLMTSIKELLDKFQFSLKVILETEKKAWENVEICEI